MSSRRLAELIALVAVVAAVVAVIGAPNTGPTDGFAPDTEANPGYGYNWGNRD